MNKQGFVYLETIIAIVILTSSLLLIYTTFNKLLQAEKARVYYEEVSYVYRAKNIKAAMSDINLKGVLNNLNDSIDPYVLIGPNTTTLFQGFENKKPFFENMLSDYDVLQMVLVKDNKVSRLKQCRFCVKDQTCEFYDMCNTFNNMLSENFLSYVKTVNVDIQCNYVLLIEFNTCTSYCHNYYAWIGI